MWHGMTGKSLILALTLLAPLLGCAAEKVLPDSPIMPPPPVREFRAAWISPVTANPDWPSKPGLPVAQQKAELIALLDGAQRLHLNAVCFQVRPACDAFYASSLEPWSDRITGAMGQGPVPFFDPLAFAIAEAHQRGLQLHAWFNPYRAAHPSTKSPAAANHITRTHPELVRRYGDQIWLDPGEPGAQQRTIAVVLDVVKRYDVDGIVFDDYFYPYPVKDRAGRELDFPDDASWKKYGVATRLSREDWRRRNVNQLVEKVSAGIKAAKPQVQFGISPFGIWRPQYPPPIKGLDAYAKIYADARLWLASGWVDFIAPQLYWPVSSREQSFSGLYNWWRTQNPKSRHVFAGLDATKFAADEITRQIQTVRTFASAGGEIHFHLRTLTDNPALLAAVYALYSQPALVPVSPWLATTPLAKPKLTVVAGNNSAHIKWENPGGTAVGAWLLQSRVNGNWVQEVLPPGRTDSYRDKGVPDAISIRAVDRLGNLSAPAVWVPARYSAPDAAKGAVQLKK